jgi:hypothetical protein
MPWMNNKGTRQPNAPGVLGSSQMQNSPVTLHVGLLGPAKTRSGATGFAEESLTVFGAVSGKLFATGLAE